MNSEVQKISIDKIIPNRFQPRKNFDEESLQELADSIRQHGIIQPLVLRKYGESFEIIAGERRYKAAMKIGLKEVPAIVMELDDASSAQIALVENIQRKDLTAIEEAKSYEKILELGEMNQEELAKRVGRNQSTVSNKLRLLNLSEEAQQALLDNKISERHARSLLRIKDNSMQNDMLNRIIENRLTVRETDKEIKNMLGETTNDIFDEIIDIEDDIPAISEQNNTENSNVVYINPEIIPPVEPLEQQNSVIENTQFEIPQPELPTFNSPVIEVNEQQPTSDGPIGGKFFNIDDNPSNIDNLFNLNENIPVSIPNFDEQQISPQNNYTDVPEANSIHNINMPQQPIMKQQDITGAVAVIRNTIINLQNNGYMINTNEQDLGNKHQIIIEINK